MDADEIGEDYNNPRRRSMNTLQLILTLPGTSALAVVLFRRVNPPPAPGYPQRGNTRKDARFPVSANTCASPTRCRDTRAIPGMGIGGRKTGD
ncbi:MAG: hypothetical protein LBU11_07995 [Zoogloeaceae bacterium]|nr:hypothetical protein [Zoogloeaceae bacterium]